MSSSQSAEWKSKCKKRLEKNLRRCELALNGDFLNPTQRYIEIQIAQRINAALERFEQGYWGLCEMCKKPIEQKRLNALPYAEFCIHCQTKLEKRSIWMYSIASSGGVS